MNEPEALAPVLADVFDEWLHRMHGVTSSCRHEDEGDALAAAVLASAWLRDHDAALVAQARSDALAPVFALAGEWEDREAEARRDGTAGVLTYIRAAVRLRAAASSHPTGDQP